MHRSISRTLLASASTLVGASLVAGVALQSPAAAASTGEPPAHATSSTASTVPFIVKDANRYWALTSTELVVSALTWDAASKIAITVNAPARGGVPSTITRPGAENACLGSASATELRYGFGSANCGSTFRLDADGKLWRLFGSSVQQVGATGENSQLAGNVGDFRFVGDQPDGPAPKPEILSAEQQPDSNDVQLRWSAIPNVTWWNVRRDGVDVGDVRGYTDWRDVNVRLGSHTYTVRPHYADQGGESDPVTVTVEERVAPGPVRDLVASDITRHDATLRWRFPGTGIPTDFVVAIPGREPTTVIGATATLTGLEAGVTYTASVTARNTAGSSTETTVTFTTDGLRRLVSGSSSTGSGYYALKANADGTVGYSNPYPTRQAAAAAAMDVILPDAGTTGRILDGHGNCLVIPNRANAYAAFVPCGNINEDVMSQFSLTPGGRIKAPNHEYLALVWTSSGTHAVLKPDSTSYFTVMERPEE